MKSLYRVNDCAQVTLPADAAVWAERYVALGSQVKDLGAEREGFKARCLHAMGEAAIGLLPSGLELRRKMIHVRAETKPRAAYDYQRFDVKQPRVRK